MVHVKGSAITARIRFVRERFGETALRELKKALREEHRNQIEARILPSQWVSYDLFIELLTQADALFGHGDLSLCREMAHFSADVNLPSLYRIFYKIGTPAFILKRAARLWTMHYESGRLDVEEDAPGQARLIIRDFAQPHRAHCLSVLGWAERSAQISGADVQHADETHCRTWGDDACELSIQWRA